ncbi:Amidase enhancer precursor [Isoptericola dokdonensis DS-3]|uniref:Amidase enhancer n=1 Tax=Isoptericola dokdonensis DS-3 TaxID=1300344 RepID=A0A161IIS0_9MICO|nr:Amidase enhancer precursor [Isoptericola dokdonensis DS-3]
MWQCVRVILATVNGRQRSAVPLLAALVAGVLALSLLGAPPAQAATWRLQESGGGTITASSSKTLKVRYLKGGKPVRGAKVTLQRKKGSSWVKVRTVRTGKKGGASVKVSPSATTTYRFRTGKARSGTEKIRVVPARFAITGSGSGHGVGLSQWGAYQQSRQGRTAAQILAYYYPGTSVSEANDPRTTLDVQVLGPPADRRTSTALAVGSGAWRLKDAQGKVVASGGSARQVSVRTTSTGVAATVTEGGRKKASVGSRSRLTFEWTGTRLHSPAGTRAVARVSGAQGTYRHGSLEVTKRSGRVNVVNRVVINTEYLYGIDEMPSGWGASSNRGAAALQAQAVVARNYAIVEKVRGLKPACGCHVYDDTRSQHYVGWRKQGGSWGGAWVAAVDATVHDGTVTVLRDAAGGFAETPYFASTGAAGGRRGTATNAEAFGTKALPYLRHVPDGYAAKAPGNPYLRWTDSITQAKARSIFGLSAVRSVAVTSRWSGGQVRTLTATSATGKKVSRTRSAEGWRTTLGLTGGWVSSFAGRSR